MLPHSALNFNIPHFLFSFQDLTDVLGAIWLAVPKKRTSRARRNMRRYIPLHHVHFSCPGATRQLAASVFRLARMQQRASSNLRSIAVLPTDLRSITVLPRTHATKSVI